MILDLHVHTHLSGDAKPEAGEYAEQVLKMRERHDIDGFVITEHRYWKPELDTQFAELSSKTGLVILQGVELETDFGHILVYGVGGEFLKRVDISMRVKGLEVVRAAYDTGAFPVVAHPTRPMVGCGMAIRALDGIRAVEHLNGGSTPDENAAAERWMKELDLFGIGGSDAHYVEEIGSCLTVFHNSVHSNKDLVAELAGGNYHAICRKQAKQ